MGLARPRSSIRTWLADIGTAGVLASALAALSGMGALALTDTIALTNGNPGEGPEGNAITNQLVAQFTDTGNANTTATGYCAAANTSGRYTASVNWGDGMTSAGAVACKPFTEVPTGVFNVTGSHTYADSGNYTISVSVTDTKDDPNVTKSGQTDSAAISDVGLGVDFDNARGEPFVTKEGATVGLSVNFFDNNNAYPNEGAAFDPGITAKVDWGDGSAVQSVTPTAPPSSCDCARDFVVAATHVFDATTSPGAHDTITVTATDDGGQQATDSLVSQVSDANLTAGAAKSFTSTATQASNHVVASFTDSAGAQAAAADFTASVKWGDNITSSGTVTKTATGAFDVRGTHTYTTSGTKSLTITVTDEEGQTLTMSATATVPALPATGQPQRSGSSGWPVLPTTLLLLGLVAIAVGLGRRRSATGRR